MFRKYIDIALVILLITGSLGVAGFVVFTNRPTSAFASSNVQPAVAQVDGTQSFEKLSVNSDISLKTVYPIEKVKNKIKIEILSAQVEGDYFGADICFDFPSDNPAWGLGNPGTLKLSNGVAQVGVYSIDLVPDIETGSLKKDEKGKFVGRCDHVRFPISDGFVLENLKISVDKLITDVPEIIDCDKAQAKLDSKNSGIKIKCINEPGRNGVEAVSKPKNMDDVQAQKLITDVLTESVDGPWEFEIGTPH